MGYNSIFDFLKNDDRFDEVYNLCIEMEKSILNNSNYAPFILGRSASEAVITIIAKNNPVLFNKYFKYGTDYSLSELIHACFNKKLISKNDFNKYKKIKKWGNASAHVDENINFFNQYKKEHRLLFDVIKHCYNKYHDDEIIYKYNLDEYNFKIETNDEQRNHQINSIKFTEINSENLIELFETKNIFIPIKFIKPVLDSFKNNILDNNIFNNDIKDFDSIDDENINVFLDYFDDSVRNDIEKEIYILNDNLSKDISKTVYELNSSELTFKKLNSLIDKTEDLNKKQIYIYIKALADDLIREQINEYKKEIENSPITQFAENGRKLLNYKNYKIVEDDYGFSLEEVDENIFLDEEQKEAVEYGGNKPLVIEAGPGSGKTRVIIERVVYLVKQGKDPSSILVITFTRKATQELKERLINETDLDINDINQIRISTVHGFCRYLISKYEPFSYNYLTRHSERSLFFKKFKQDLGFVNRAFTYDYWIPSILDEYDKYFSFKVKTNDLIQYIENKMAPYEQNSNSINNKYKNYIDDFYNAHNINELPNWEFLKSKHYNGPSFYYRWLNVAKSYPIFLKLLENNKTCDDNNVLVKANAILENEFILNDLKYKNILIDEFQDTDHNQKNIFEKLLKIADTFTIVGDVDQSIYGWRGAFPEYFNEFLDKDVKHIILSTNYRSSRNIVEFNEELIKNQRQHEKNLKSKKKYHAPVYHLSNKSIEEEANNIVTLIRRLIIDKKVKYLSDIAVLFRRNASVDNLIKLLEAANIKYHLKENNDFLDQNEVKAMLLLYWYVMPYDKYNLNHLGDEFLNLAGFKDTEDFISSHIFRLSEKTQNILYNLQKTFEKNLKLEAKKVYKKRNKISKVFKYGEIFDLDDDIKKEIFNNIDVFDIGLLDKEGLIKLGITDENDLKFFLKLNDLKFRIWANNSSQKLKTLKIYYDLLNMSDYFAEISIDDNPDDIKIKNNLALFSDIINDYENIMGDTDYLGLANYLYRVLKGYSCPQNELDEGFDKVHLLSMHSAKGLEYPIVIMGSIKDGLCPLNYDNRGLYDTPNKFFEYKHNNSIIDKRRYHDEELRTIYVASTRAKEILIYSTIGRDPNDVPDFFNKLKHNSNVKIKLLEPYNLSILPKVESSKVFKHTNDFPRVKFEEFLEDYLYCPYRYDLANNTRFKVKVSNDKYVNMILHNLLNKIHTHENISTEEINHKINSILNYHNIGSSNNANTILNNVSQYWETWGKNYKIIDNDIKILSRLKYCDLNSTIDLVIEEDNKISIVQFIPSDKNIPEFNFYKVFLIFYSFILKNLDQYKNKEFNKIYLHSLENNQRHEIDYDFNMEQIVVEYIDEYTKAIYDNKYNKLKSYCSSCEYYGSVCKG